MVTQMYRGVRIPGAVVNIVGVVPANAVPIFQQSNILVGQVGTRSFKIKRVKITNNAAGNIWVLIGTGIGAAFLIRLPQLYSVNGMTDDYGENDLPEYEFFGDATCHMSALAVNSVDIQVEAEEVG